MSDTIILKHKNQTLTVNRIGGGIKKYFITSDGAQQDILYGYDPDTEKAGSMGDILFPWPGRVENCQYNFEGKGYTLSGVRIKEGHANHGFVKTEPWEIVRQSENSASLRYLITKVKYEAKGFPFDLSITVSYLLNDEGLTCTTEVTNSGQTSAPFGLGFHPYYTVGAETINEMRLHISAQKLVEFDESLKPTGRFLEPEAGLDFRTAKKIGSQVIDNCYTDLEFNDGIARTEIYNDNGNQIIIWQDKNYPYLQVYSADTIGEEHFRKGLALEPQTCTGYALNMPEMGLRILKPAEKFEGRWGVISQNSKS